MINRSALENVLASYQIVAQSNRDTLRSLIPSKEMWRFYIDGRLQNNARSLVNAIDALIDYDIDKKAVYAMTIAEFIIRYDETFESKRDLKIITADEVRSSVFYSDMDDRAFKNFIDKIIKHNQQDSVTIENLIAMDNAWLAFEAHEAGYLLAVQRAAHYAYTCHNMTVDDILEIQRRCGDGVEGTNYESMTFERIGKFRQSVWTGYAGRAGTLSIDGIFQVLKNIKPYQHFLVNFFGNNPDQQGVFHLNATTLHQICLQDSGTLGYAQHTGVTMRKCYEHEKDQKIDKAFTQFRKEIHELLNGSLDENSLMKLSHYLYDHMNEVHQITMALGFDDEDDLIPDVCYRSIVLAENMPADQINVSQFFDKVPGVRAKIAAVMNQLLDELQRHLKNQLDPATRLMCIITFIQDCEQLHPFTDLNCRTFCMVMLQELLQRNGFPPAILDDPNCFDMCSHEEIFDQVVQGMQRVFVLISTKKLYGVDTDLVLAMLRAQPFLTPYADQFNDFVQAEENARHELTFKPSPPVSALPFTHFALPDATQEKRAISGYQTTITGKIRP